MPGLKSNNIVKDLFLEATALPNPDVKQEHKIPTTAVAPPLLLSFFNSPPSFTSATPRLEPHKRVMRGWKASVMHTKKARSPKESSESESSDLLLNQMQEDIFRLQQELRSVKDELELVKGELALAKKDKETAEEKNQTLQQYILAPPTTEHSLSEELNPEDDSPCVKVCF